MENIIETSSMHLGPVSYQSAFGIGEIQVQKEII